jgi:FAD/FMN-containing dehydrogenase
MTDIGTAPARGALDSDALSELREGFRGDVIEPGDARYDETRQIFNGMFDRRPAAILRPTGTADVIRAIGLARLTGLPFAIRSGGHSVAGFSSCDSGIVLDLRALKGIRIDPERRTARVQAGVDWGELDRETQQFGLAVTGGRVTSTGVIGFTTGSGSGWLERKLGFACDSLISADVVTADGDVVVATEHENADLLWALKGGGGNFGVITEAEFRLHPLAPIVYGGLMAFDPAQAREVISTWRDISADGPEELGWAVGAVTAPPEPFVPVEWQGRQVWAVLGQYAGPSDVAEKLMAPLRALGPLVDLFQPMPYTVVQTLIDGANPYGRRNYWRAHNADNIDEQTIDTMLELADAITSPFAALLVLNLGGAVSRVSDDATALGGRAAPFAFHLNTMWEGEEHDDENIAWTRRATEALSPWISPGMGLNFYTEIGDDEIRDTFGSRLDRLRKTKQMYDPQNLFRLNQNITPA